MTIIIHVDLMMFMKIIHVMIEIFRLSNIDFK